MATATKKSTSKKAAPAKTAAKIVHEDVQSPSIDMNAVLIEESKPKTFAASDLISCRSVRNGLMQHIARKSGNPYEWSDFGDVTEVEYGDLLAMKASKSKFIFAPWIIIEDEEAVISLKLEDIYETFKEYEDVEEFLNLSPAQIRSKLANAPIGFKDAITKTAANMIREGRLDSISVIKAIDDVLHKNLSTLITGGF